MSKIERQKDTNEEYHGNTEYLGTSTMFSGYDSKTGFVNLAKVKAYMDGMNEVSSQTQKIFDLGNVQHEVILEQNLKSVKVLPEYYPIPAVSARMQKEAWIEEHGKDEDGVIVYDESKVPKFKPIAGVTKKAQIEEFKAKNPATYYLSQKDFDAVKASFDVLASQFSSAEIISKATDIETSFYDHEEGLKCRPDIVGKTEAGENYICNYKTIADLNKVNSHMYHLSYDLRAMQEIEIVQKFLGEDINLYYFLFQEKVAPYSMRLIKLSVIDMEIAWDEYQKTKNKVLLAVKQDNWPQPPLLLEESMVYRDPRKESF